MKTTSSPLPDVKTHPTTTTTTTTTTTQKKRKRKNPEKLFKQKIDSLAKTIRTQIHKLRRTSNIFNTAT
jgi:hypothetical protein